MARTSWKTSRWKSNILSNGGWLLGDWGICFLLNFLNKNVKMWSSDVHALVHTIVSVITQDQLVVLPKTVQPVTIVKPTKPNKEAQYAWETWILINQLLITQLHIADTNCC